MENDEKIREHTTEDLLLLELEEIRKQINHISDQSDDTIPDFSKAFLLEDLKQYENYLIIKLTKKSDIKNFR
jgi:hypothetical protein